ncbi:MAG: hypothetical protein IPK10_04320 [Bacteroidetes bacterium]|nr:hypothetical protein [Bacteroidota bacterium]
MHKNSVRNPYIYTSNLLCMLRILIILILFANSLSAQFTDRYWIFGDSAAIDFKNLSNPQPSNSILRVRGTCASICDSAGDLLFLLWHTIGLIG